MGGGKGDGGKECGEGTRRARSHLRFGSGSSCCSLLHSRARKSEQEKGRVSERKEECASEKKSELVKGRVGERKEECASKKKGEQEKGRVGERKEGWASAKKSEQAKGRVSERKEE